MRTSTIREPVRDSPFRDHHGHPQQQQKTEQTPLSTRGESEVQLASQQSTNLTPSAPLFRSGHMSSSNPLTFSRPTPIRIPDARQVRPSTPSPRAALVAELRSATDRRKRDAGVSPPPASPGPLGMVSAGSSSSSLLSSSQAAAGSDPGRIYATLYAKQQELLATSMLISQQQQRLQDAMNSAVYGDDYASIYGGGGSSFGSASTSPLHHHNYSQLYLQQQQYLLQQQQQQYNDSQLHTTTPLGHHYHSSHLSAHLGGSQYYGFPNSDLAPPQNFSNRPASPSLPQRPSSSTALRGSFLFSDSLSSTSSSPGSSPQPPNATPFRRGHRKASSLSSYTAASNFNTSHSPAPSSFGPVGNNSRPGSGLINNPGIQTGNKIDGYSMPIRQPYAPPPLEELKSKSKDKNFALGYLIT